MVGRLRLSWEEFWSMTWGEFNWYCHGYHEEQKDEWRRARLIAVQIYNGVASFSKKPKFIKDPEQYLPLNPRPRPEPKRANVKPETLKKVASDLYGSR